jgi:hypothetical protein
MSIENFFGDTAVRSSKYKREGIRTVPFDAHHIDRSVGDHPSNGGVGLQFFEFHKAQTPAGLLPVRGR